MVDKSSKYASLLRGGYYGGVQQPRDVLAAIYASALSGDIDFKDALEMAKEVSLSGEQGQARSDNPAWFGGGQLAGNILTSAVPAGGATKAIGAVAPILSKAPIIGQALSRGATAIGAGAGFGGTVGQGAVQGGVVGGLTEGKPLEGAIGGGVGGGLFKLGGRIIKPMQQATSTARKGFNKVLQKAGIDDLSIGQMTGNKGFETVDSVLHKLPVTAGKSRDLAEGQLKKFTQAAMKKAGIDAEDFSPAIREQAENSFNKRYSNLIKNEIINIDSNVLDSVAHISAKQMEKLPTTVKPIVQSYLRDIMQSGGKLSGAAYQETRSQLSRQSNAMMNSDPFTAGVLKNIRNSLDEAAERSLPEAKKGAWRKLNNQYRNYKTLQKAGSRVSQDSLEGIISPASLLQAVETANKTKSQKGYGELYDLARAGRAVLSDSVPDSGTAQRLFTQSLLTGGVAAGGGIASGLSTADAAKLGLGAVMLPKVAQGALATNAVKSYLTKGIPVLNNMVGRNLPIGGVLGGLAATADTTSNTKSQDEFSDIEEFLRKQNQAPKQDFSDIEDFLKKQNQKPKDDFSDIELFLQGSR